MRAESAKAVQREELDAELERVLASKYFTRAPKLARLLQYLCQKYFAGESQQIKEYSIAVEVFGRNANFDQDSDSIVRVEANRLRRQLAEYYAEEGSTHALHLRIPVGQYVPEFAAPPESPPSVAEAGGRQRGLVAGRRLLWLAGALTLLLAGVGATLYWRHSLRSSSQPAFVASADSAEAQIGPPAGEDIRILAGSSRSLVDHAGKLWSADRWFEGGNAVKSQVVQIWRTQDPSFYRASRQGQFRYRIPLKKGIYELHLHFAETDFGAEKGGGEGSRIFSVRANGRTLLEHFDLVADAGAGDTADVKVFTDVEPAQDGVLTLEFTAVGGSRAILSGIELLPGLRHKMRAVRLLPRQSPYYSNDSHWWSPDTYFAGGQMASYSVPVGGTDDPELYEGERWGNFSYAIPVAAGRYSAVLHFVVRRGHGEQPPAEHLFDLYCNGHVLLQHFDLAREAHGAEIVVRKMDGLEPNAQGKLLMNFVPVAGYATVAGIEILPE